MAAFSVPLGAGTANGSTRCGTEFLDLEHVGTGSTAALLLVVETGCAVGAGVIDPKRSSVDGGSPSRRGHGLSSWRTCRPRPSGLAAVELAEGMKRRADGEAFGGCQACVGLQDATVPTGRPPLGPPR